MKFSERLGYRPVTAQLQIEEIGDDLKNSLWSAYLDSFLTPLLNEYPETRCVNYVKGLWFNFFKKPIDTTPISSGHVWEDGLKTTLRNFFLNNKEWYEPYDLLQYTAPYAGANFVNFINEILEREKSGYRFVELELIQITSPVEIDAIEKALGSTTKTGAVHAHLDAALKYLADKKQPVYRNSVKESISAVEALCKMYTNDRMATLGDALTKLEKDNSIHPAMKKSFSALYGYTSDSSGIRHALLENDRIVDFHEAKFMLVTCTSFINYLLGKMAKT